MLLLSNAMLLAICQRWPSCVRYLVTTQRAEKSRGKHSSRHGVANPVTSHESGGDIAEKPCVEYIIPLVGHAPIDLL